MTKFGERLIAAAKEANAIARGEADASTYVVHYPPPRVDVKSIRQNMDMTQKAFGESFGFGIARVRDWEQGRTTPAASDRVLLTTISEEPQAVFRALQRGEAIGTSFVAPSFAMPAPGKRVAAAPAAKKAPPAKKTKKAVRPAVPAKKSKISAKA